MRITLVVDAYNAINKLPKTRKELKKGLMQARETITGICKEYVRSSGFITDLRVVFDGNNTYRYMDADVRSRGNVQVFSDTGKGDEKIIETVRKESQRGRVILASNDNYVRNNSRAYGASLIRVEELAGHKKRSRKKTIPLRKEIPAPLASTITREYREELGI